MHTGSAAAGCGGKLVHEPIARGGPFVMNTEEEIRQAWEDYERGTLF